MRKTAASNSIASFVQIEPFEAKELASLIFWRNRMREAGFLGVGEGGVGFGNISCRCEMEKRFLISGTQTGRIVCASEEHFAQVTAWDFERNCLWCKGPLKASSESLTHAAVYEASPSVQAVVHAHHRELWERYREEAPCTSAPYGTVEMAKEVMARFGERAVDDEGLLVMGGHQDGLLAFGNTIEGACGVLLRLQE